MNLGYFKSQLHLYNKEALKERSERIIDMYRRNPEILAYELISRGFFERMDTEAQVTMKNSATDLLSELGVFSNGRELEFAKMVLDIAQVPAEYLDKEEVGGTNV